MFLTRNIDEHEENEKVVVQLIPSLCEGQADIHHHNFRTCTSRVQDKEQGVSQPVDDARNTTSQVEEVVGITNTLSNTPRDHHGGERPVSMNFWEEIIDTPDKEDSGKNLGEGSRYRGSNPT
jgi:1,4-alpha-glucan branching enzyme